MKTIETERLIIRQFKPEDWKDLLEYISREEVLKYEPCWVPTEEACRKAAEDFSKGNVFWAAELKGSGKMIGHVYFNQAEPKEFKTWEIGYIFNPVFGGNGYATEACRAVMGYGFGKLNIHRVTGRCSPENVPSWKLLERLRMRREGHSLQAVTFTSAPDGGPIWWDEYLYAVLAGEWQRR